MLFCKNCDDWDIEIVEKKEFEKAISVLKEIRSVLYNRADTFQELHCFHLVDDYLDSIGIQFPIKDKK